MKVWVATLCLTLVASNALAIQRYTSTGMSCDRVRGIIDRDGAALMRYKSTRVANLQLYGRYVRSGRFCQAGQVAERSYIPTSDTRSCPVLECKQLDYDDPFLIIPRR